MAAHPETSHSLERWIIVTASAQWKSPSDVSEAFSKAKVLDARRVRFEVQGGNYRLICAFDFRRQTVNIKFIGTHAEYDRIDALTVSRR